MSEFKKYDTKYPKTNINTGAVFFIISFRVTHRGLRSVISVKVNKMACREDIKIIKNGKYSVI
jgi:hypothetical protein